VKQVLRFDANGKAVWVDKTKTRKQRRAFEPDVVSDSMGCTLWDVDEKREDAKRNGFNVEFVEDKGPSATEGFYPCKGSPSEMARYERYRKGDEAERNAGGGNVIGPDDIAYAERLMRQKYPTKDAK
jgi:hypothetical protein